MFRKMVLISIVLLCAGCSAMRQAVLDISTEDVKNIETAREVSLKSLSIWTFQSGFIKGTLGNRINELPNEAIQAIDELDRLAELPEQSDYELGLFLGLKVRLLSSVVQIILEKYAPDVVDLLPLVF